MESATKTGEVLGVDTPAARRRKGWWFAAALLSIGALATGYNAYKSSPKDPVIQYKTEPARRGDLRVTVTATGQLEALRQVEIGTEVSGTVRKVLADFNQRVQAGQVLVELDTTRLKAQIQQTQAAVMSAEAALLNAHVSERDAATQLERLEALFEESEGRQPSRFELDTARTTRDRAVASKAAAEAGLSEARARLSMDRTNLEKATIRSPIEGLVLQRKVEPGQTVAASLQTPVLFVIAESLSQMELHVAVDEADVGQVHEGQAAKFTVDAYPTRSFPASITQVRYAPEPVEGVVTYETLLRVDNEDLSLRPGMTATAEIIVAERTQALLVPSAALRFEPPAANTAKQTWLSRLFPRRPPSSARRSAARDPHSVKQRLYVLEAGKPVAREVTIGATNGTETEVVAGDVTEGQPVVLETMGQTRGQP